MPEGMGAKSTMTTPGREPTAMGAHRLVMLFGPDGRWRKASAVLIDGRVSIGRAGSAGVTLALDDAEVSRNHAIVEPDGDGVRLHDAGSRNGTFLNGVRVEAAPLSDGDVLRMGSHFLLLQYVSLKDARALSTGPEASSPILGNSLATRRTRAEIRNCASSEAAVLILGESGVGKELVAKEIHDLSGRSGELVPVNCAALPATLIESELFGHVEGAFTGARAASHGLFGQAERGTLLLDEIGEMATDVQAKLLRVLSGGEVRRVGGTKGRPVDVRIVASTNVDLAQAVEKGTFRGDLHARLAAWTIAVPPLRARRDDILPLMEAFLSRDGRRLELTPDAAEALLIHDWRFNVRELEQLVHALPTPLSTSGALAVNDLPEKVGRPVLSRSPTRHAEAKDLPLDLRVSREGRPGAADLAEALRHFDGNVARLAEFFGRDRKQIYRWLEKASLDPESFREDE